MVFPTTAEGIAMFFRPHLRAAPEIDSRVDSSRLPIRRGVRSIGLPIWILIGAGSTDRADVPIGNAQQSLLQQRDRWFESGSLQRRVRSKPCGMSRSACRCSHRARPASAQLAGKSIALTGGWPDAVQVCVIGYLAKISSTRLNAFSAAACGVALS